MIKVSDFIAKYLRENYGIEQVFMVSGGGAMHLNDSFGKYIPYVCNHHEQACSIAAEGYARVNQKLAVVNVTTGPGGLNCLNGLFGQWTDSVPVLYVSGQVKTSTMMSSYPAIKLRQLGDQEVDIISTVKHLTKYSVCVKNPLDIKYHIDRAVYEATHNRKGPVWLDIPIDVQACLIDENVLRAFVPEQQPQPSCESDTVVEFLKKAKAPLIVAGHGIRLSNQIGTFHKLVDKLQIPVVTTFNGLDLLSTEHPCNIGSIGTIGNRSGNFALQNADLVLCLGTRNNIRQVSYNWENFAKNAFKIIVDIDNAELQKPLVKPDLPINADLSYFLPELLESIENSFQESAKSNWLNFCRTLRKKYSFNNTAEYHQVGEALNPYYVVRKITEYLADDDVVVSANATPSICMFQGGKITSQRVIINSGDASMGYALPASIGASFQSQGRVVVLEGDGSIMMNIQELQTIAFNNIPVKIFVFNNDGYSSIRQTQRNFFDGHFTGCGATSGVGVPDFCKVSEAFGIKAYKLTSPKDIDSVLSEVLNSTEPVLCEIMTAADFSFSPKLSSKKLPDGSMVSSSLEDMFPFLPKEELERNMSFLNNID